MKKVVGPVDGAAAWSMLDLRDRGLTSGGSASLPPGSGRMLPDCDVEDPVRVGGKFCKLKVSLG